MRWTVITTLDFAAWLENQSSPVRDRVRAALQILATFGPGLGRPHADTIKGSTLAHLKELRVPVGGVPYRLFYAFDPVRRAVVLCGGNKAGDGRFYQGMIRQAEIAYAAHLDSMKARDEDS